MLKIKGRFVERVAYTELKLGVAFARTKADDRDRYSRRQMAGWTPGKRYIQAKLTEQIAQLDAIALSTAKVWLFRLPVQQPVCKTSHSRSALRWPRHTLALRLNLQSIYARFQESSQGVTFGSEMKSLWAMREAARFDLLN